ncbi:2-hydroxyisocaproyl-CoA dehydratase activator [Eubacterium plexicaudatum ASF492]|uniref:ATPase BadF/BadG/BcrA/BcrD type domain-containing protein n=1 Tax=Eubacterium plexicaudatum ASF492 TaxID=1235802 RepID=N2ATI4_9FIRM|nr:2-hydroxyisocaproyl-CoA dehydratase activator [Eubacterium plexicaudatum ASF492]
MHCIGIDIGSTYTKYCIMDANGIIEELYSEKTPVRQKEYFMQKIQDLRTHYPDAQVISCGYGKRNVSALKNINELTALACGMQYLSPGMDIALDIGGQDTKVIIQNQGALKEFFLNDKCAAGCGMFLINALNLLKMGFKDIELQNGMEPEFMLSSVCAVFAQSEMVELLAQDYHPQVIIRAVVWQILNQAKTLLTKVECDGILLTGGMTKIAGIKSYAERVFGKKVVIPQNAAYLSAIGCAVKYRQCDLL